MTIELVTRKRTTTINVVSRPTFATPAVERKHDRPGVLIPIAITFGLFLATIAIAQSIALH